MMAEPSQPGLHWGAARLVAFCRRLRWRGRGRAITMRGRHGCRLPRRTRRQPDSGRVGEGRADQDRQRRAVPAVR